MDLYKGNPQRYGEKNRLDKYCLSIKKGTINIELRVEYRKYYPKIRKYR